MLRFHKLCEAINFAKQNTTDKRVYAYEKDSAGKRNFIVCSASGIFDLILNTEDPHYYEILTGGTSYKLYLDIEYDYQFNPDMPKTQTIAGILSKFSTHQNTVILESKNPTKCSFHIIFGDILCSSLEAMRSIVRDLAKDPSTNVRTKHGGQKSCIDVSPYTRNQNFRLPFCSKFGRNDKLEPSDMNHDQILHLTQLELFKKCLIVVTIVTDATTSRTPTIYYVKPIPSTSSHTETDTLVTTKCLISAPRIIKGACRIVSGYTADTFVLRCSTATECMYKGRVHKSNGTYYVFKKTQMTLEFKCTDQECIISMQQFI